MLVAKVSRLTPRLSCCKKGIFDLKSVFVRESLKNFQKTPVFEQLMLDIRDGGGVELSWHGDQVENFRLVRSFLCYVPLYVKVAKRVERWNVREVRDLRYVSGCLGLLPVSPFFIAPLPKRR